MRGDVPAHSRSRPNRPARVARLWVALGVIGLLVCLGASSLMIDSARRRSISALRVNNARLQLSESGLAGTSARWMSSLVGEDVFHRYFMHLFAISSVDLTDAADLRTALRHLRHVPEVEDVFIERRTLTDEEADLLTGLPHLKLLCLSHSELTADAIETLSTHSHLEAIDLSFTTVTDDDIRPLIRLPHLQRLDLSDTNITGDAFQHEEWSSADRLMELNLKETRLNFFGFVALGQFEQLQILDLEGCSDIASEAATEWGEFRAADYPPPRFAQLHTVSIASPDHASVFGDANTTRIFLRRQPRLSTIKGFHENRRRGGWGRSEAQPPAGASVAAAMLRASS